MAVTKNFGSIVALIKKSTPPTITSVIWYDTTQVTAADSFKVYDNNTSSWVKLIDVINANANGTDLSITPNASNISLNSSTGTDVVLPASTATNAGLMTAAQFSKLLGIEANAKDDQTASEVPVIAISGVTGDNVQAVLEDLKSQINSAGGVTNLGISLDVNSVTVTSDTGADAQILAASALQAGVMTAANFTKLSGIQSGAEVNKAISLGTAGTDIFAGKSSDTLQIRKLSVGGNMSIATQPGGEIFIDALSGNATVVQPAQSFATDGVETDFTLVTADANPVIYLVEVGGVAQVSGYTISGLTVSFDVAPANGTTVGIHFFTDVSIASIQAKLPDFVPNEEYGQDAAIKRSGVIRVLKSSVTVPYTSATFVEADWDAISSEITSPANTIKGNDTGSTIITKDLTISEVIAMLDAIVSGNNGNKGLGLAPGNSTFDLFDGIFKVQHFTFGTYFEVNGGDLIFQSDDGAYRKKIVSDTITQQVRLEIRNKTTDALIQSLILDANGLRRGVAMSGINALELVSRDYVYSKAESDALISPAVANSYNDTAAMIADQASQSAEEIFRVGATTPYSYYEYLGTTVGDITDYSNITTEVGDVPVKASTADAESGTNDTKFMTPLKVVQLLLGKYQIQKTATGWDFLDDTDTVSFRINETGSVEFPNNSTSLVTFDSASGSNKIIVPENIADALTILAGGTQFMRFISTTGSAGTRFFEPVLFDKEIEIPELISEPGTPPTGTFYLYGFNGQVRVKNDTGATEDLTSFV